MADAEPFILQHFIDLDLKKIWRGVILRGHGAGLLVRHGFHVGQRLAECVYICHDAECGVIFVRAPEGMVNAVFCVTWGVCGACANRVHDVYTVFRCSIRLTEQPA